MSSVNRQSATTDLHIRLFGPFEITLAGRPLTPRTPKDLKALAYLILKHRAPVERAEVATACWTTDKRGDRIGPSDASRLLSRAMSELARCLQQERRRLEKPTPQSLQFQTEGVDLDLLEWETGLMGGIPELERLGTRFRGQTLLADWNDLWVLQARERIQADYLGALEAAALRAQDHGDWDNAIRGFELIFDIDPWYRETLRRGLELLFERRRFAAMGQLYDRFLERCAQQSRPVDGKPHPGPPIQGSPAGIPNASLPREAFPKGRELELRERYRTLREAANRFLAGEENGWLPTPISGFVARPADIDAVVKTIGSARLTTLTGVGGIGKTRLAIAAAETLQERFFDRVWFIDLTAGDDPASVSNQVAHTLRLKEHPGKSSTELVCEALRTKEALLVLDNCEHLLEACAQFVEQVLEACPKIRVLTTSREPLRIVGEAVWRVPGLEFPPRDQPHLPEAMESFAAVRLLKARASLPQFPFLIDSHNAQAVGTICRRLEGIPLAIELAAVQIHLQCLSAHEVADSLTHSLSFLTEGSATAPPRRQTLRGAIEWSYDLLSATERVLFARLAVFVGGFTAEAVLHLCPEFLSSEESAQAALQSLVEKSLVEIRTSRERRRYRFLQPIHEFALERLEQGASQRDLDTEGLSDLGDSDAIRRRHLDYCIALIAKAEPHLAGKEQAHWFDRIAEDHENIRAALHWALRRCEYTDGLQLAAGMAWFWYTRDHHREGAQWLDAFLAETDPEPTALRLKAVHWAGNIAYAQADYVRARGFYEEGLQIRKRFGSPRSVAIGQASLANVIGPLGDHNGALTLFEENLAIFRELGDLRNAGISLINMGIIAYTLADYPRARSLQEEALSLLQEVGDEENIVLAMNNLIGTMVTSGDLEAARNRLPQCLLLCRDLGSGHRLANCLVNYVTLAIHDGDWQRAAIVSAYEVALRKRIGHTLSGETEEKYLQDCVLIRSQFPEAQLQELTTQGEQMTEDELMEFLLMPGT